MKMTTMTPEFLQQLMLATLLADRCDENGTDYEESTYEHGVRDALQWVAGVMGVPPHNPQEYQDLSMPLAAAKEYLADRGGMELLRVWTEVDMPSNSKVVDPNNPVAQLMRTVESALNDEEMKRACKTMGPTCRGCPDCGPVMGDATYQEMFGKQQDGV